MASLRSLLVVLCAAGAARLCGAQATPSILTDGAGGLVLNVVAGQSVAINQVGNAGQVTSSSPIVTQADMSTTIAGLQATIAQLSTQLSTLQARTTPPTPAPTPPPTPAPTPAPTAPPTVAPTAPPTAAPTCPNGPAGSGSGCATWRDVTTSMFRDIGTHNCDVTVDPTTHTVAAVANGRGCGQDTLGSSMGIYISGPWTKIRYTTTVTGRTSCYSMFGSDRYNMHVHTDNTDANLAANSLTSLPYLSQIGADGGGLFLYDPSEGDTLSQVNWPCPGSGWTCAEACSNTPHPWYGTTSNLRQINVTLRRRYNEFAGGTRQYAELAGPSVGVTCVATGATSWNISNLQVLY